MANGDLTLGVAGVDLIYVRLAALLCAADRVLPRDPSAPAAEITSSAAWVPQAPVKKSVRQAKRPKPRPKAGRRASREGVCGHGGDSRGAARAEAGD